MTLRKDAKKKKENLEAVSSRNKDNFRLQLTELQKPIVNLHRENDIVILLASPGSGKDFMQVYRAMSGLINKEFEEVIFMRTILEATSSKIGFLPGDEKSKEAPYLEIFYDQMRSMLKPAVYERLKTKVKFEYPGFARGKTFGGNDKGNVCIILSEGQNCELRELILISTRLSEGSKLYINSDPNQSDIGNKSGILDFCKIVENIDGVCVKELGQEFQMRGRLVQEIDNGYRKFLKNKSN
jgi:phosphate starvation-inducible protein PhoH